ncbi:MULTISPECIES: YebC/PmpR family DNA-binding transcriptional regulator [unclassified Iodidimonas]|jgi:YebC/PmpR family DNA-binding regulatory protein|uniref:YebC/PmpR family DNA-binding transcriptional regulator n=1 Tax=unclassified Iodidimonas TaxID=2626145 RepID=UPI00248218C0|nr:MULTISPECIES: YebC/PmpR family DNA-binding transcriptional regulator [unclassified Iodidimonas]
MAGHSKFKNIMHRKGAQDAKRAKIFAKLGREITVAAKMGLPDPDMNPRLRTAILAAKTQSMPKDRIERAIASSQGGDAENYDELRYEGFGPGGIALIVDVLTDNKNRSASDLRTIFSKNGGNLGETGSANFMFDRVGAISFKAAVGSPDDLFEAAVEAGADNVESDDDIHEVLTSPEELHAVAKQLEDRFGAPESARLIWKAKDLIPVSQEDAEKLLKLLDALDDNDDVQEVFGNYEISDDIMAKLDAA